MFAQFIAAFRRDPKGNDNLSPRKIEVIIALELCVRGSIGDACRHMRSMMNNGARTTPSPADSPLSEHAIAYVLHETAVALSFLHGQSIVHRDVKGSNIFIGLDGSIKLADFDTACVVEKQVISHRSPAGVSE